jgi:phage antirepressor YoqD-like protein
MVNATEMAKPFGKSPYDFLRLDQTKKFIAVLTDRLASGIPVAVVNNGGDNYGSWMHQKLALKFAAWLSPEFELWVYDRIEELLKLGFTATQPTLDEIVNNPDVIIALASKLKEERAAKEIALQQKAVAEHTVAVQDKIIKEQAPKVEYHDKILNSMGLVSTNEIANVLGVSARRLNVILSKTLHIQYKQGERWVLCSPHRGKGYVKDKTHYHTDAQGNTVSEDWMYWTQEGKHLIYRECFKRRNKLPEVMRASIEKLML